MCYTRDEICSNFVPTTGAIFSPKDVRDYQAVYTAAAAEFPKEFELKMVRVKNQGFVGSCVAHSLSEVIEYFNGMYGKLLSTTDRDEYKAIHNELYQSLAKLMYGDGLEINGKNYTIRDFEGLGNQNDAVVF